MPSQTVTFGIPYPLPTDPVAAGANDMRLLAEKVDALPPLSYFRDSSPGVSIVTDLQLNIDDALIVNLLGGANRIYFAPDGRIYFGDANDTSLYRNSAGVLATPGDFSFSRGYAVGSTQGQYQIRAGSYVVTLDASARGTVPFSPPFPAACTSVVVMNGNVAAATFYCNISNRGPASFTVSCPGASANQGVELAYIAIGY